MFLLVILSLSLLAGAYNFTSAIRKNNNDAIYGWATAFLFNLSCLLTELGQLS